MKKDREEIKNTMQMIGKRIRFHRRAADITQEELALEGFPVLHHISATWKVDTPVSMCCV